MSTANELDLDLIPGNVKKAVGDARSSDLWLVPRNLIRTHPKLQPRDKQTPKYKERVRYLADLIKSNGYDRAFPLKVYAAREDGEDVLYLVQGHRRLEAVDLVASEGKEIELLPCVSTDRGTSMEDLLISTVTGNEGEPLTPIEKAGVIRDLQGCNMELDVIAKRLGYTLLHVKNLLSILEAPREVREMVQEGKVSAAVAVQTVKEHGKNAGTILRSGLEVAQSKGKDKVTPKHLREVSPQKAERKSAKDGKEGRASKPAEAPEKLAPTHADEAIDAALQRGAGWIVQEVQAGDEAPFISLVAATLGLKDTAALQELVAKLR